MVEILFPDNCSIDRPFSSPEINIANYGPIFQIDKNTQTPFVNKTMAILLLVVKVAAPQIYES